MLYRNLGSTGLRVSEIGWGAEHMEGKPFETIDAVLNTALDGGVNVIDVFMPQPEVRSNIGRALGKRRKDVIIQGHIGAALNDDGQYLRTRATEKCGEFIEDFLTRFNTDYIDIGMVHFVDTEDDYKEAFDSPYIEYVQKLKKDGVIRYIGASTHSPATGIKMINTGIIDMVMFSINPVFDFAPDGNFFELMMKNDKLDRLEIDPVRVDFYSLCAAKGIGINVMKPFGGGRLLDAEKSNLGSALTVEQCLSFALDRPAVSSVLAGAQTVREMQEALDYENATPEQRDYTAIMQNGLPFLGGKCMYCNHCLPCPQGIDIAAVTKYLDMAQVSDGDTVRAHYNALPTHGSDCIECGTCEKNCPFGIGVTKNMKEAAQMFGK